MSVHNSHNVGSQFNTNGVELTDGDAKKPFKNPLTALYKFLAYIPVAFRFIMNLIKK